MNKTDEQYNQVIITCREIFENKLKDYGTAWRILRMTSITDQIYIKASRIRSIEEKQTQKVNEGVKPEFIGLINYSIIGLIQLELSDGKDNSINHVFALYDKFFKEAKKLMESKNHDYDEAWRIMRISSYTDLILMKINRIKQIEDNEGKTIVSEGIDANLHDIINYSVFALIKLIY